MSKHRFKFGDRVIITDNFSGHGFDLGDVVTIEGLEDDFTYLGESGIGEIWWFRDNECVGYREAIPEKTNMVDHPPHYGKGAIECIDYIEDFLTRDEYIGYLRGNIAKYMHRFRYKNGVEDVEKAKWYLERLIEVLRNGEEN